MPHQRSLIYSNPLSLHYESIMSQEMKENTKAQHFDALGKDDIFAAMILASLKHSNLHNQTSGFKHKVLGQTEASPSRETQPELQKDQHNATALRNNQQELQKSQQNATALRNTNTIDVMILPRTPPVEALSGLIGQCSQPFEKQLTASDVDDHQHRLAIPYTYVESALKPLFYPEEDVGSGVPVTAYDWEGREYQMDFKIWHPRTCVLIGDWKRFYHDHGLKAYEDWVTVWMFRHSRTDKPCFVFISRRLPTYHPIKRCKMGKCQGRISKIKKLQRQGEKKNKFDGTWEMMKQNKSMMGQIIDFF